MASCLVPDFPAVMIALEHLGELDKQLKEERVPFSPEASLHLREITAAITELEASRRAVHEQLEVETIENGKLRDQVQKLRDGISKEITADVAAARESNADEMEQLHNDLNSISQLLEVMVKRQEALFRQNAALYPERELVKAEHSSDIVALNYQISQKASRQIQLNQTLNKVDKLKTCIAALEQNKITLQQNMILERETFTVTKDDLLRELDQAVGSIQQQKQENERKSKELEIANIHQRDKEDCLIELTNQKVQLEHSIQWLTASQCQCEKQLKEEIQNHHEMVQEMEILEKELCEVRKYFNITTQCLQEDVITVDLEMEESRTVRSVYQDSLGKASESFKSQRREEDKVRAVHLNVSRQLERSRLQLEERIASIIKHRNKIGEMEEEIRQLLETNINKGLFQKSLEELHSQLDMKKKNICQFEEEKVRLSWLLEEAKREQEEHVGKASCHISDTRRRYQELQQEEVALQQYQSMSCGIDSLASQVTQAEIDYIQMENTYHQEIEQYTAESEHVARCSKEKEKEDRKTQQEVSIQRLKESTSSLLQPKEQMKAELVAMRAHRMDLLANQASELRSIEISLYDNGLKLEQVNMENSRLHLCIAQMKDDIANAGKDKKRYLKEIDRLREEVSALFEHLLEAWREDLLVTREYQDSDGVVLKSLGFLLDQLQTRRLRLGNINTHLHQQLLYISKLLDKRTPF
ncbi:uncharacterized protein ccdc175 [Polymixia lowei]